MQETLRTMVSLFGRRDVLLMTAVFCVLGTVGGVYMFPDDYSVPTRAAGGFLMGLFSMFFVMGPRMVGGADYDG